MRTEEEWGRIRTEAGRKGKKKKEKDGKGIEKGNE